MEYFLELTTKISKLPKGQINDEWIKFQQQNRTSILSFIKILKKDQVSQLKISEMKSQELTSLTQCFIDFVSKKQSYESKLFLQVLAALDCILSCSPGTFSNINFNSAFCSNIRKYFCKLCDQYQNIAESQQEMTLKFQFYTVFYMIVILVYQSGKGTTKQVKKIPLQIMNKTFIANLLEFQAPKKSKIRKLISFLILYLVKKGNMKLWGKKLTYYILNNFEVGDNKKTIFNYIFCLRELNNNWLLDDKEIKKFDLMAKLKQVWLEHSNDYQSYYVLDLVQQILKIDPIFCQDFCDAKVIDMLGVPQKLTNIHPSFSQVFIQIFEVCHFYLDKSLFRKNLLAHLQHWKQNLLSLKYVKIFIDALNEKQVIEFLHSKRFSELSQILIHKDENYRMEGVEVIKRLIQKISTININLMNSFYSYFYNFLEQNEALSLQNRKQMLDRIQYYYQRKFQDCSGFSLF